MFKVDFEKGLQLSGVEIFWVFDAQKNVVSSEMETVDWGLFKDDHNIEYQFL
jgi:hypothetical protein